MGKRGIVNETTFKQVKLLLEHGLTQGQVKQVVRLSLATIHRMNNHDTFEDYKQFVREISSRKEEPTVINSTLLVPKPDSYEPPTTELTDLGEAITRLAVAIENNGKTSFLGE